MERQREEGNGVVGAEGRRVARPGQVARFLHGICRNLGGGIDLVKIAQYNDVRMNCAKRCLP